MSPGSAPIIRVHLSYHLFRLRNERRKYFNVDIHYPHLGTSSDWLKQIWLAALPIRSTIQIWVVACHMYGISTLLPQTSFSGKTSRGVDANGRSALFSGFKLYLLNFIHLLVLPGGIRYLFALRASSDKTTWSPPEKYISDICLCPLDICRMNKLPSFPFSLYHNNWCFFCLE